MSSCYKAVLTALLFLCLCPSGFSQAPDLILTHGKIFTSDTARLYAEAVAIRGGRIQAVGTSAAIQKLAGSHTRRINLQGRTVIPGINDAHDHIGHSAIGGRFIAFDAPLLPGPSLQQVLDSPAPPRDSLSGHFGPRA